MKNLRKNLTVVLVILSIVLSTLVVPEGESVKAESYRLSMCVEHGEAFIDINGTSRYQLTEEKTVIDGGFSKDGTLFLLFRNNLLFWYSYEMEGDENILLHFLDSQVTCLNRDSERLINGYVVNGTEKKLISKDEIEKRLISGDKENVILIPARILDPEIGPPIVKTPTPTAIATVEPTLKPTATAIAKPTLTPAATTTIKPIVVPTSTVKVTTVPSPTATVAPEATLNPIEEIEETVEVQNNDTIVFRYEEEKYILSKGKIVDKAGLDKKGTVWMRFVDGGIYCWHPVLQKHEAKVKLIKVTASSNCLLTNSNGVVTSWYDTKANKRKLLTLNQIYTAVRSSLYKVFTSKTYKKLCIEDSDKVIDTLRIRSSKVMYHNLVIKNVKYAAFNQNGNVVIITNNGKLILINRFYLEKKTINTDIKNFKFTSKGIAKYAVKKNGSKINLETY